MNKTRRQLMTERDAAIAAKDWATMNALTRQLADLPLDGVPALTDKDITRYVADKKRRAS